jgi:hypothetical protein
MSVKPKRKPRDLAFLQGPTDDGKGARVLRLKDGELSAGEIRPAKEGEPLADRELVRLTPLQEGAPVCEVEVLHGPAPRPPSEAPAEAAGKPAPGPARVSSDSYRKNWSTVFGAKRKRDFSVN